MLSSGSSSQIDYQSLFVNDDFQNEENYGNQQILNFDLNNRNSQENQNSQDISFKQLKDKIQNEAQTHCFEASRIANIDPEKKTEFEDYQCQICLMDVINNPVQCPQCKCIFGYNCANKLFEMQSDQPPKCPSCKKIWLQNVDELKNRWIKNQIAKQFQIRCSFEQNGCKEQIRCSQDELQEHENKCQYREIQCPDSVSGCKWKGLKKDLKGHEKKCPFFMILCVNCAKNPNEKQTFYMRKENHRQKCQNKLKKCHHCYKLFPNKILKEHVEDCDKRMYKCDICKKQFDKKSIQKHLEDKSCFMKGSVDQKFNQLMNFCMNQQKEIQKLSEKILEQEKKISSVNNKYVIEQKKMYFLMTMNTAISQKHAVPKQQALKLMRDLQNNIYHIHSLRELHNLVEANVPVKEIVINETDLGKYQKSLKCGTDFSRDIQFLKNLAGKEENVWSQFSLAFLYYYGDKQIPADLEEAIKLSKKLTEKKNAGGYWLLGKLCQIGEYVEQDEQFSFELYNKCFQEDFAPGINMLGYCYCNGIGVERDEKLGIIYYQLGAKLGFFTALFNLGCLYFNDEIIERNDFLGFKYCLRAAEKGCVNAMRKVEACYKNGEGVEVNIAEAECWDRKASEYETYFQ